MKAQVVAAPDEGASQDENAPAASEVPLTGSESLSGDVEAEELDVGLDEAMLKEEEEARLERSAAAAAAAAATPAVALTKAKVDHLDHLLKQAAIYSQFLTEQTQAVQDEIDVVRQTQSCCMHITSAG